MPDEIKEESVRANTAKEIAELKRVVKALLQGMEEVEKEIQVGCMPEGSYYGIEF